MVRINALTHSHELLTAFARYRRATSSLIRLAPVFEDSNMLSEGEWNIKRSLAEKLGDCADIMPPDAFVETGFPLLYRLTKK